MQLKFRHRVTELIRDGGAVTGVSGEILEPTTVERGAPSSRVVVGDFSLGSSAVIVTSGGVGGNHDLVRRNWPGGPDGRAGRDALRGTGFHRRADAGRRPRGPAAGSSTPTGCGTTRRASSTTRRCGPRTASASCPGRARCGWTRSATGCRRPLFPGFDALGALRHIVATGRSHSWFLLDMKTIGPEFNLSGSEQNPDFAQKSVKLLLTKRAGGKITPNVQAFLDKGVDFLTAPTVGELVAKMNALVGEDLIDADAVATLIALRDGQVRSGLGKDAQVTATIAARKYFGDKRMRTVEPHEMLDPDAGPLIAVRLHILTRKTLGGLETDLSARALGAGRQSGARAVRGRRGGRVRRRRDARLPRAGGLVPRRLPVLRADRRSGRRRRGLMAGCTHTPA